MTQEYPPLTEGVYYILLALFEARHGYGIMQLVEEMSKVPCSSWRRYYIRSYQNIVGATMD